MAHVLVVDDIEMIRIHMVGALRAGGHEVWTANDGNDARKALRLWPVSVVIVDLFMPDMDGIELIQAIRREHPMLPVIVLTGASEHVLADFLPLLTRLGVRRVMQKPPGRQDLLDAVAEVADSDPF